MSRPSLPKVRQSLAGHKVPSCRRRVFFEALEERRVLASATFNGGELSSWSVFDNETTTNGLPVGGSAITSADGTGAAIDDASYGGQFDAFDFAAMAWVNNVQVGGALSTSGQTATFAPVSIAGLTAQLQFYFATTSATARILLTLQNPTAAPITVPVNYAANFGSDGSTAVQTTSSGDATFTAADRWIVTDDSSLGGGDPANTTVLFGPGAPAVTPASVSQTVFSNFSTDGVLANYSLSVNPGQTRSLMFFQKLNASTADASSQAATFFNFNPVIGGDLLAGLSVAQVQQIANWRFESIGATVDDVNDELLVFDPGNGNAVATIPLPANQSFSTDVAISPDGAYAYVSNFYEQSIYVVDLTTNALATGPNPIHTPTTFPEDLVITPDGRFLLISDGGAPIVIVDLVTRAVATTTTTASYGIETTINGDVLVGSTDSLRHFTLDNAGNLTDTGEALANNNFNVAAAPNGITAVATNIADEVTSFTINGMTAVQTITGLPGSVVSMAFSAAGTEVYLRTAQSVVGFNYNPLTGEFGAQRFNTGPVFVDTVLFFGVDQLDVSPDGTLVFTSSGSDLVTLDAVTGAVVNTHFGTGQFFGVDTSLYFEQAPNAAPVVDLNGADAGIDIGAAFVEDAGPVSIASQNATVTDADAGASIVAASIIITNQSSIDFNILNVDTTGTNITSSSVPGSGILTLTGTDTLANYEAVLRTATYDNLSQIPGAGTAIIEFSVNDGRAFSAVATSFVSIIGVPDFDFGDAPESYGTLLPGGAQHFESFGPFLGGGVDFEPDGQPSVGADGDDFNGFDDDDGVAFLTGVLVPHFSAGITVFATASGILDAWIDFNRNGTFDTSERIASGVAVVAGDNALNVTVPDFASSGTTYARFRISSAGVNSPTGNAADGEVEDYAITLQALIPGASQIIDDPEHPGQHALVINGTSLPDAIVVRRTSPSQVTVYIAPPLVIGTFPLTAFDRIVIFGREGSDSIVVEAPVNKPATIFGDAGNDAISGGPLTDTISGGDGIDSMVGNDGDDVFLGGPGNDVIVGGLGFDRIVEVPGSATVTAATVKVRASTDVYSLIEQIELRGTAGNDIFTITNVSAEILLDAGAGNDTLAFTGSGNIVVTNDLLTQTSSTLATTVQLSTIEVLRLNGGVGNDRFNLSQWTKSAIVGGGFGTDTIVAANDLDFTLQDTALQRSGLPTIMHSALENAQLMGGESNNAFTIAGWTKAATLNGGGGFDTLLVTDNAASMTLSATSLTRAGKGTITHSNLESAALTGGSANNTISGSSFTGPLKIDGAGGNDTLTGGAGPTVILGGNGNDTLRSGAGRTILIGGLGVDRLTGSTNEDVLIDGTTVHDADNVALSLLLMEWASAASYNDRVAHLLGTPGGINGSTNLGGPNVTHDTSADVLAGAAGLDLFFAKIGAPAADTFTDFNSGSGEQRFE